MQLIEVDTKLHHWRLGGIDIYFILRGANRLDSSTATIEKLPNEVLLNVLEKFQDFKHILYNCLLVSKRWHDLTLPHLWHHFEFGVGERDQLRMLSHILSNESASSNEARNPNFSLVRSLFLNVNLKGEVVNSPRRCQQIANAIIQFNQFVRFCTGLRSLRMSIYIFIETDALRSQWELLQESNTLIVDLVQVVATRKYDELFLDIPQRRWQFDDGLSGIHRQFVGMLSGQVTRLHLHENASLVWPWFSPLSRLRRLNFENNGNPGQVVLAKFWDTIAKFRLEELSLSGITFPRGRKFKKWNSLRLIHLNQFNDVEGACATILQSFPNLRSLRLNNPINLPSTYTAVPIEKVVCTGLQQVTFTRCRAQENVISLIAKACPFLEVCMPPSNASDSDIITLINSCRFLTTLLIDGCTSLTSVSIKYIPRADRLRSLLFDLEQVVHLNEECIIALAENCPDLHRRGCRILPMGEKNERRQRVMVRQKLPGDARYKRWLMRFIEGAQDGPYLERVVFNIDEIRMEIEDAWV